LSHLWSAFSSPQAVSLSCSCACAHNSSLLASRNRFPHTEPRQVFQYELGTPVSVGVAPGTIQFAGHIRAHVRLVPRRYTLLPHRIPIFLRIVAALPSSFLRGRPDPRYTPTSYGFSLCCRCAHFSSTIDQLTPTEHDTRAASSLCDCPRWTDTGIFSPITSNGITLSGRL
jgi:hypothetical protein